MRGTIRFLIGCLAVFLLGSTVCVQVSLAQGDPPLNFGTNYFVTGDYVVAGAQGLNASFGSGGLGTGIISFPDGNPGIRGATTVPEGANIVAALLYWQTVEKAGSPGSGKNGFFGPVVNGKLQQLYPISGVSLPSHNATSFSSGGCSGTSTGKDVQTYRTDVRGYLPLNANGNVLVNSADGVKFEVRLPNVGLNTPYTLGATLVIIYRVISPNYPLNVITIFDGGFAPNTTPNFTMSQLVPGFYDAATNAADFPAGQLPFSKLTHIVGAGKSNKFQQAYLGGGKGGIQRPVTALPSPYGNGQPAFPGYYGNWDNTTWVFPDPTFPNHPNLPNPLEEDDDSATATVVANGGSPGCVSWSAVIVGTTVHDDDMDGILRVWKENQGYTDVATGQHVSLAGAARGQKDVFIQLDHVKDSNGEFTPPVAAVTEVENAFLANGHNVHLHITDASQTTGIAGANAIPEPAVADGSAPCGGAGELCPYPNQVGITTWRDGFELVKNQPLNYATEAECEANSPPLEPNGNCVRRFPPAQRSSYHYAIWGDTLGGPNWTFLGGMLTNSAGTTVVGAGVVAQTGANTVTFYTTRGHGLTVDAHAGNGRVTVAGAITNPSLNGTHLVTSFNCPVNPNTIPPTGLGDCSFGNPALGPYIFTISVGGTTGAKYTLQSDPYLSVASGQAGAGSGFSDVGGPGTLITLYQWGADATPSAQAGTLAHELGHTIGLLHGGGDNTNCKSNYQSVMNYMFQASLLGPSAILDFSNQQLNTLNETSLGPITTMDGSNIAIPFTKWYDKPSLGFDGATITSFAITSNVVTFQAMNNFTAGTVVQIAGLTTPAGLSLNGKMLTVFSLGLSSTQFEASFNNGNVTVSLTPDGGTATTTTAVPIGNVADHHCDGTSLTVNDPTMSKYAETMPPSNDLNIPWSTSSLDANFIPGTGPNLVGYNDWANADFRQVGAGSNEYFSVPGAFIPGGPGGFIPGGPGGFIPGGPGGFIPGGPGITAGGRGELDFATAVSTIDPPSGLTASEANSARTITLNWNTVTFPLIGKYNIYRSANPGTTFSFVESVAVPPALDTVTCNPAGYQYYVTAVFTNTATITSFSITSNVVTFQAVNNFTAGTVVQISGMTTGSYLNGQALTVISTGLSGTQFEANFTHANVGSTADSGTAVSTKESSHSNIVSTGQNGQLLTGCYGPTGFNLSAPANAVQGSMPSITWTLQDLTNQSGVAVNRLQANTSLAAIGPIPPVGGQCQQFPANPPAPISLLTNGVANEGQSTVSVSAGQFTYNFDTDPLAAGCYFFKLVLDSGQSLTTASALQLAIDVTDADTPHITTVALPTGTVGLLYNNTVTEEGGTGPSFTWTFTPAPSLPPAISQQAPGSPTLYGTSCNAGTYNFTAMVTDSANNTGTRPLTLQIIKANTTTTVTSNANPFFQQPVTFTVTVKPQYTCTPTGGMVILSADGNPIGSTALNSGTATFTFTPSTLTVGPHNITASYAGDPNFNGSNSSIFVQTVIPAQTTINITSVSSPAIVGQAVTLTYTFAVVAPGEGAPIPPSGNITATFDGSVCVIPAAAVVSGVCMLYPTTAGNQTLTVTYPTDGNFVGSGANNNYTVYIYVSDTAPPPYTPNTTLPNTVVGSPYNNTVYESGGVTTGPNNFSWTIVSGSVMPGGGSTLPGLSFQANAAAVTNGTLSGTPTQPGIYTFTAMVTDSAGNTGTQTFTLNVFDALLGDLIVVDGSPSANPLAGTVFRVTPTGTAGTIAAISNGQPTGVAVDSASGNIYVAVAPVSGSGTARVVKVGPSGSMTDPFISAGVFTNPVAVAVDGSGNVFVGDNTSNNQAIYEFNSSGTQVNGNGINNAFATLPNSSNPNHIRMAFDSAGNLDVASDGLTTGPVEVDQIAPNGTLTPLYNTTTTPGIGTVGGIAALSVGNIDIADYGAQAIDNVAGPPLVSPAISATPSLCCNISGMANPPSGGPNTNLYVTLTGTVNNTTPQLQLAVPQTSSVTTVNLTYSLTAAAAAVSGNTAYSGNCTPAMPVGSLVTITGFAIATNNGTFTVVSCSSTQLVVNNASGASDGSGGKAVSVPLTYPNDVAWYSYPTP